MTNLVYMMCQAMMSTSVLLYFVCALE